MEYFSEYEKIPVQLNKLVENERIAAHLSKTPWVVTEKVHGANFSFVYDGKRLRYAKRKEFLKWNDDFFGFQAVVSQLEDPIMKLFEQLSRDFPASQYVIYGELFGGTYPHPDVPEDKNAKPIQTGIFYSPDINFCAFDIALIETPGGSKTYISYDIAVSYFTRFKLVYAQILLTGKLDEALNFDLKINSTIPSQLGLPLISDNYIEGIVIKPLHSPGKPEIGFRPILKLKNPAFDEQSRFHKAEKWSYIPEISSNSEGLAFLIDEMHSYVTINRLKNVISKIGFLTRENVKRKALVESDFLEDVIFDFNEHNGFILRDLTPKQTVWVRERITAAISKMVTDFVEGL
jgi:Rnl2 family RNA ligase